MVVVSDTLARVQQLVARQAVRVSDHAYDELIKDDLFAIELFAGVARAVLVEDYPTAAKGPSVLLLQQDFEGLPVHVVWGIPKGQETPAVIITAYRPDPTRWSSDFARRKEP
jgi:hypothetical protein